MCFLLWIDDATWELMEWMFAKWESLEDMLTYWFSYFEKYGKPESIYIDCHATYKINHGKDQFDEESKTRFAKWMQRLEVQIIYSKCPQGKGRIERSFMTHQDRMIKFMRLEEITTNEDANEYFDQKYRKMHNDKFAVKSEKEGDAHKPFTEEERRNYKRYFALESKRKLRNDGTIRYKKKEYQVKKWERVNKGREITVHETIDWEVRLYSWKTMLEVVSVKDRM